jgi:pimeloyl-ACP methyl ester carboxylesterase
MNFAMKLHYQLLATESDALPVILIHGLFGNLDNLGVLARDLNQQHSVVKVDLRNHGLSPRSEVMTYPEMAQESADVAERFAVGEGHCHWPLDGRQSGHGADGNRPAARGEADHH